MKECFILRGLPGSGKTTISQSLAGLHGIVHEADSFCYNNEGVYEFKIEEASLNHKKCFDSFCESIDGGIVKVVQSNTNTAEWQFMHYVEYAKVHGYIVHVMLVENYHGNTSIHDVPLETIDSMKKNLENSISLEYRQNL